MRFGGEPLLFAEYRELDDATRELLLPLWNARWLEWRGTWGTGDMRAYWKEKANA